MNIILIFIAIVLNLLMWRDLGGKRTPLISRGKKQVLVDTSILIDGRFLAVAKTGFINFDILIPRSVVGELQLLADGGDDEKRVRARYGLDIISALQAEKTLNVSILADGTSAKEGVDNRLMELAKKMNATIMTADYNLNKVAKVEGIEVLNINELVQSVRADYLPGEKIMLEITQKGNEKKQGIGHLPDSTMVVVENAESLVGTTCEVEFIRSLQTAAGKMMFARIAGAKAQKVENAKNKGRAPKQAKVEKPAKIAQVEVSKLEAQKVENSKTQPKKSGRVRSKSQSQKSKSAQASASNQTTKTKSHNRRRTQKSAEASLVELANRD
jgi:rRNA-processing protein FCF1